VRVERSGFLSYDIKKLEISVLLCFSLMMLFNHCELETKQSQLLYVTTQLIAHIAVL
jgi:hypothetical protein